MKKDRKTDRLDELLEEFLEDQRVSGRIERSIKGLKNRVPWLFAYMRQNDLLPEELGIREALGYRGWLQEKTTRTGTPYSNHAIAAYLVAATSFCEFLKAADILLTNPFKEIRKVRTPGKLPRNIPREKELSWLLADLSRYHEGKTLKHRITYYKVHVIAELMYATGMRISEVAGLSVKDLDLRCSVIHVKCGKGGRRRVAFLNEYARDVLQLYVERMRPLVFNDWNNRNGESLFGVKWDPLTKVVNRVLQERAQAIGLGRFTSHMFRHALGFHLLRAGCNIRHIQSILGHKMLHNTEIYTKVDKEDLRDVLDRYHPRKWRKRQNEKTDR